MSCVNPIMNIYQNPSLLQNSTMGNNYQQQQQNVPNNMGNNYMNPMNMMNMMTQLQQNMKYMQGNQQQGGLNNNSNFGMGGMGMKGMGMGIPGNGNMTITFRLLDGAQITIQTTGSNKTEEVIDKFKQKVGDALPSGNLKYTYNGAELQRGKTLSECGINDKAIIFVMNTSSIKGGL